MAIIRHSQITEKRTFVKLNHFSKEEIYSIIARSVFNCTRTSKDNNEDNESYCYNGKIGCLSSK